jgi:hypothetical protein
MFVIAAIIYLKLNSILVLNLLTTTLGILMRSRLCFLAKAFKITLYNKQLLLIKVFV